MIEKLKTHWKGITILGVLALFIISIIVYCSVYIRVGKCTDTFAIGTDENFTIFSINKRVADVDMEKWNGSNVHLEPLEDNEYSIPVYKVYADRDSMEGKIYEGFF